MRIDPAQRRAILFAASQGALPKAWLDIASLAVPPEGLAMDLGLQRGAASPCLMLGRLDLAPGARRRSRQVSLTPNRVVQLAAASDARLLTFQRDVTDRLVCAHGLPCLGLSLAFETPLPSLP